MSPAFIMAISKKFKCGHCGRNKLTGYSVCAKHLIYARVAWGNRVRRKMILGECAYCHRRHVPNEQRCRMHKQINRENCHNWSLKKYWSRKRDGLCVMCLVGMAKPAADGTIWCREHREERRRINQLRYRRVNNESK